MKMSRRLSDGKLYLIFLMAKYQDQIKSSSDGFYFITVREVENINEVYDLEINLEMAR